MPQSQDGLPFSPHGLHVLAVDDDKLCLKVIAKMLQQCHYEGNFNLFCLPRRRETSLAPSERCSRCALTRFTSRTIVCHIHCLMLAWHLVHTCPVCFMCCAIFPAICGRSHTSGLGANVSFGGHSQHLLPMPALGMPLVSRDQMGCVIMGLRLSVLARLGCSS